MKRFLLALWLVAVSANAQPLLRNSLNTNALDTNLVWAPSSFDLSIRGFTPSISFWNTAGAADQKRYDIAGISGKLRFYHFTDNGGTTTTLGEFSTDGTFAPVALSWVGFTNLLTISSTNTLLLDGVPIVTGSSTTTNTVINSTTVNVTSNIFNIGKGGSLTITNAVTPLQVGASKVVGTAADGSLTNLDGVFTTRGSVLYRNATVWTVLTPNTAGYVLTDGGAGADPAWAAAAAGGGSSGSTNYRSSVITLTMTTTNVDASQIDWLKTNVCYRLMLTTNAYFSAAVCINVPDTNSFQWLQLNVIQDATGGRTVTFTNSVYAGPNGTFAITTNASAWDSLALINSPQTNSNIAVLPSNYLHR